MALFDWFGRGRGATAPAPAWQVSRRGDDVVVDDGRGKVFTLPLGGAQHVRVVPLTGGDHHAGSGAGWQVALGRTDGDVLVGPTQRDWQSARDLARKLCDSTGLGVDDLTGKLFSRVGQFTPNQSG